MGHVKNYSEFLNEAILVVKRKYTELHPEKKVSDYAPVRERVLSFVKERQLVSEEELVEFLRMMNEETGRKTSIGWVKANLSLFKIREKNDKKTYALSAEGLRIHEKITKSAQ
jgi:hypothetical protein